LVDYSAITKLQDGDQVSFYAASVGDMVRNFQCKVSTTGADIAILLLSQFFEADIC